MFKRKKKFSSKRSAFKLEALEQRQLLATITGGTEVNTDVVLDGKTYDQVMMTGSSVTVTPDAGQIVRVDFLDADGDIVRAEYAGAGSMTVSLANASSGQVAASKYATTTTYMQGLATITISGSDGTSNLAIYSVSTGNAVGGLSNTSLFGSDGSKTGGDNLANVARVIIQANSSNPIGGEFGSIFGGNAIFGDSGGTVGIVAPNIQFKSGTIAVGNILPTGTATGVVQLGQFSDNKTLTVRGGQLTTSSAFVGAMFRRSPRPRVVRPSPVRR